MTEVWALMKKEGNFVPKKELEHGSVMPDIRRAIIEQISRTSPPVSPLSVFRELQGIKPVKTFDCTRAGTGAHKELYAVTVEILSSRLCKQDGT